ncbi:MAG TPA: PmoA family protein, partial [Candidatus Dormibacteraeota bacterium]|nr:PmoA family protein [Candidatus Dormibacteraeota bacterium]
MSRTCLATLAWLSGLVLSCAAPSGVKITQQTEKLRVEINGQLFTEYHFAGAPHVYFYPVLGPGGAPMTRNWPMKEAEGEERDHPHHRSLWYSHGAVNGFDFWAEGSKSGQILHDKFLEVRDGAEIGIIRSANRWVAPDGEVVITDERVFRVYARPDHERLFDFEVTLKAGEKDVVFGDTKEGAMAIRVNEEMRLTRGKGQRGAGHIVQSTGVRDGATWGKRADWCDYYGPVHGKTVGIAIFDHPSNPKHPTWWHVRDYGLFAANPFGVHDFEKRPEGAGNLAIPKGASITFKYRFYMHEG